MAVKQMSMNRGSSMNQTIGKPRNDALVIVVASSIVLALAFGVRTVFGGIVEPLSRDLFDGRIEVFSLAIAIQNLVWGLAQPVFGIIADKFGDRRALWLGFVCYGLGLIVCVFGTTPLAQHLGAGVLVGMGISGTAFGVVLAAVGRAAPPDKRSTYLGIVSAMGSVGQVLMPLLMVWLMEWLDWRMTMLVIAAALIPMALCIPFMRANLAAGEAHHDDLSITEVIRTAFGHSSYVMLALGFFVCGFHLAFITAHFPNFVQKFCLSVSSEAELRSLGLQALALVGFANIFGTLLASRLGQSFPKPMILASIYTLRAVVILVFINLPITPLSVMIFAFIMGGLWLATVPLTSALVLVMYGPRAMGTLFGFVFLSHQLGGFFGVWLGGIVFDEYANYDLVWNLAIALGIASAIAHLFVQERPASAQVSSFG